MKRKLLVLALASTLLGCGSRARVEGTWTGQMKQSAKAKGLEAMAQGFASAFVGDIVLEFNKEGKYKASAGFAGGTTGDYSISGNTVTLTPSGGKSEPVQLTLEGETLRLKKDFASDPDLVLARTSKEEP